MSNWYPLATVFAGPAWKAYGGTNPNKGVVCHSAEGYKAGLRSELLNPNRRAQWHFSVYKDGAVDQHWPLTAVLAHGADWGNDNDGANANGELIAIEHEGKAGEPLTTAQREASVALVRWIAEQGRWEPSRTTNKTLWEHRELSDTGTACPSDRIPWQHYILKPVAKPVLSSSLNADNPGTWYGLYDAVTGGTEGTYKPLPQTRPGWGRYEFEIRQ